MRVVRVVLFRALADAEPVLHERGVCGALGVADVQVRLVEGRLWLAPIAALVGSVGVVQVALGALGEAQECVAASVVGVRFRALGVAHVFVWRCVHAVSVRVRAAREALCLSVQVVQVGAFAFLPARGRPLVVVGERVRAGHEACAVVRDGEREGRRAVVDALARAGESVSSGARVCLFGVCLSLFSRRLLSFIQAYFCAVGNLVVFHFVELTISGALRCIIFTVVAVLGRLLVNVQRFTVWTAVSLRESPDEESDQAHRDGLFSENTAGI